MELYTQWPILEFAEVKASILARFSAETGESVSHLLVKELVQTIDNGTGDGGTAAKINTEADLEWVMQILNHAFSLSFANSRDYETIHSAVRIYVTWCSALSLNVHPSCPPTLQTHPDRYFRRILEAMRLVFAPREADLSTPISADSGIRQAIEMRVILEGLRQLSTRIIDEYKDEVWSQLIRFLLNVNALMLNDPYVLDDAHSPVANDLIGTLFTCWTTAALSEHIPSPAFWKTLTLMARKWSLGQVSFVEHWGRHTLQLGAIIMANASLADGATDRILSALADDIENTVPCAKSVSEAWFRLFHVFPRPIDILLDASNDLTTNPDTVALVFYLSVLTHARLIDIILGDTKVSIDFAESLELTAAWANNKKEHHDEWSRSYHQQRSSSMSTTASASTDAASSSVSGNSSIGRKHTVMLPTAISRHGGVQRHSGRNNNTIKVPELDEPPVMPSMSALADMARPKPGQFVHHYLKANPFRSIERANGTDLMQKFSTTALLEVFLYFLGDAAAIGETIGEVGSQRRLVVPETDAVSSRSMSSVECENFPTSAVNGNAKNGDNKVTRRSFATSAASSTSDYASVYNNRQVPSVVVASSSSSSTSHSVASDGTSMDGLAAGRAAAIGALCRIVCEKSSTEELPPTQLAQFYLILHKALIERDRLTLCSVLYYGTELFKLGLRGVEILLPNYLMAVDIILTESLKLRLHPSISEVEMRHTCLQALASIVAWPTTFDAAAVIDEAAWNRLGRGQNNVLEQRPTFLDLRQRLLRTLVHALRNESDSTNLHLALSSCAILVAECCGHDMNAKIHGTTTDSDSDNSIFAVSALKSIVSAICDNISKPAWTTELTTTLAALDCLNALASSPRTVLFAGGDMSTGSLVVTSLARFIEHQLQKPPPLHSRDLHSSVVAAYSGLAVWLSTTPELAEIESCLANLAKAIEFGLTGGCGLASVSNDAEHKPASLRVRDAADNLLNTLLNLSSSESNGFAEIVDERKLLYKFGPNVIDTTKFRHFLLNQSTLIAVYEASKLATTDSASSSPPAVILVTRTPYSLAHASLLRLKPSTITSDDSGDDTGSDGISSTSSTSDSKQPLRRIQTERRDSVDSAFEGHAEDQTTPISTIKQFEFPADFDRPLCQLDAAYPPFGASMSSDNSTHGAIGQIVRSLESINARLAAGGGSASGERDTNNVWIQSSLGALLSEQLKPIPPVSKVNSIRNFLFDFGLLNAFAYGSALIPLDSGRSDEFYRDLHQLVDRTQVRATQTVGIFYVREGQTSPAEILDNALYLDETCAEFCGLLADLGECVDVANHAHWTGHWATAYSSDRKPIDDSSAKNERYTLDGLTHCLWSADSLLEVAYVMYSERSRRLNTLGGNEKEQQSKYSSVSAKLSRNSNVHDAVFDDDNVSVARPTSPDPSSQILSRRSDVSQQSHVSGSSPATAAKSIRTKSSSTINSETGSHTFGRNHGGPSVTSDKGSFSSSPKRCLDQRIFIVWLERIEDMYAFPTEALFDVSVDGGAHMTPRPDHVIIFLHPAEPELIRVHVDGIWTKHGQPGPLVDGAVVSIGALPALIRQTVASIARRRCLVEIDGLATTFSRRRHSIQNFAKKYATTETSYIEYLDSFIST